MGLSSTTYPRIAVSAQHSVTTPPTEEIYANVMETLIAEAVDRRLAKLSRQEASYVKRVQVIAYALNRVPPLYAASKEGFDRQCKRARRQLADEIRVAVNQAFAAIQRDPLKTSTPLYHDRDETLMDAEQALAKIRTVFGRDDLSWGAVANWVVRAAGRRGINGQKAKANAITETAFGPRRREAEAVEQPQHQNARIYGMRTGVRATNEDTQIPLDREPPPISVWDRTHHR